MVTMSLVQRLEIALATIDEGEREDVTSNNGEFSAMDIVGRRRGMRDVVGFPSHQTFNPPENSKLVPQIKETEEELLLEVEEPFSSHQILN